MTIHLSPAGLGPAAWSANLRNLTLPDRLALIRDHVHGSLVFTTSFGLEDQALIHALREASIDASIVTLDTGRLFDETLELWAETEMTYGIAIRGFVPDGHATEMLVAAQGPLGFRRSIENRQACCGIRKVEPLGRALAGAAGWLTGLRSDQSAARGATPFVERDEARQLLKFSPLADWTREDVASYVARNRIPFNPLHDRGYRSIGCAPCTRAVEDGEDERAGRWWWETETKRECGLHNAPGRRLPEPIPATT